jgi:anhydro-N-acetylmuramic acid kinase
VSDREVIIAGGGARNPVLMERLTRRLAPVPIRPSDELGLPADAREAVAFALLADAFLNGIPANIPAVTGARHPVVLGSLVPGPRRPLTAGMEEGMRA